VPECVVVGALDQGRQLMHDLQALPLGCVPATAEASRAPGQAGPMRRSGDGDHIHGI
jgi:hypothetical protein